MAGLCRPPWSKLEKLTSLPGLRLDWGDDMCGLPAYTWWCIEVSTAKGDSAALSGDWEALDVGSFFPRPLIPLLLFLYVVARCSQISRSASDRTLTSEMFANF